MSRTSIGLAIALALPVISVTGAAHAGPAQQFSIFVNTTEDLPVEASHCLPGDNPCSLRAAIEKVQASGVAGTIRACYDPATTPGGKKCPPGRKPMDTADVGYQAATGRWVIEFGENAIPFTLPSGMTTIDFSVDVEGWTSPKDNKIVISPGASEMDHAFIIEGSGNVFKGFEIRGAFQQSGFVVREDGFGNGPRNNQFGPGLSFAGIDPGVGIIIRDRPSIGNRIVGNWCGLAGDGTVRDEIAEDCFQIMKGASRNVVGGSEPADRNVLAGSRIGSGVSVLESAQGNQILGNWIGLNAMGQPEPNAGGVTVKLGSNNTEIVGNRIGGNRLAGIAVFDTTSGVIIRDNLIGVGPDDVCLPNGDVGVSLNNQVTNSVVDGNLIHCNKKGGLSINGASAKANRLRRNLFSRNDGQSITLGQNANGRVRPPVLSNITETRVIGSAGSCQGGVVEIYSDPNDEASHFEGETVADGATGLFIFEATQPIRYRNVTATCTDINNNSSALAAHLPVGGMQATPTPTRTPIPTPTGRPNVLKSIYLPITVDSVHLVP